MLRSVLMVIGLILAGAGLVLLMMRGVSSGLQFLIWGAIVVIAVLCERWRYRRLEHPGGGKWQRTGERFEDPETGESVEVLYDPDSGERRYVKGDSKLSSPKK